MHSKWGVFTAWCGKLTGEPAQSVIVVDGNPALRQIARKSGRLPHRRTEEGPVQHPRQVNAGINPGRPATGDDRCRATVLLHGPLRRSLLAAAGGYQVPRTCGCTLSEGHRGAHHGLAYDTGVRRCWFRWDEWGFHLGGAGEAPYASPRPHRRAQSRRRGPPAAGLPLTPGGPPAADGPDAGRIAQAHGSPELISLAQALWAVAAALKRLADTIAAEHSTLDSQTPGPQGRHARNPPT
jgi:hypothetical protein